MALLAEGEKDAVERGLRWLRAARRRDGGWPPHRAVSQSTWVTALAAMLPPERLGETEHARAVTCLLRTAGEESAVVTWSAARFPKSR